MTDTRGGLKLAKEGERINETRGCMIIENMNGAGVDSPSRAKVVNPISAMSMLKGNTEKQAKAATRLVYVF